ncbi:hypothetical protein D0A34_15640 [Microcoleus vaginatus PCC 9802]|nr:hypothetical protein D0A34_15640 [Microcoleus vaginatus PCC 9802]
MSGPGRALLAPPLQNPGFSENETALPQSGEVPPKKQSKKYRRLSIFGVGARWRAVGELCG